MRKLSLWLIVAILLMSAATQEADADLGGETPRVSLKRAAQPFAAIGSCEPTGGTGGISGQVTIPGGAPQQFVTVTLYTDDGRQVTSASTNAAGDYQFSGLKSGSYLLYANPSLNGTGYAPEWYNHQTHPSAATPIVVFNGVTTAANIQLALGTQISGQVTASGGGPLNSLLVEVYDSQGNQVASDYTNASGLYTTSPGLISGQYRVSLSSPGGQPYLAEYYNNQPDLASATVITATAPTPILNLNVTLDRAAQITGRVTHAVTGTPVLAGVSVYGDGGSDYEFTDVNGYYTTTAGLKSGAYTVTFRRINDTYNLYGASQVVSVTAPNTFTGVNGTLSPGAQITGRVTDASGTPLSGVYAYVFNNDSSVQNYFNTSASGIYTATALPSGSYGLLFFRNGYLSEYYNDKPGGSQPDYVTVTAPNVTTGIDAALTAGGGISGTVTASDTGLPLSDVDVYVYDATGDNVVNATTNASGQYKIPASLPGGQYRLYFEPRGYGPACGYASEWYNEKATPETADPITVTEANVTTHVNVALARGNAIMGTVVDATTAAPLRDIYVDVYDALGEYVASGYTNFLGNYLTSPALPSGTYRLRFSDYDRGYVDEYYNDKLTLNTADAVAVTAPTDVTGVSAALAKGGFISGRVTAADTGAGLPYIEVTVYDASGEPVGYGYTESDGRYRVSTGLATGSYRVGFTDDSGQGPARAEQVANEGLLNPEIAARPKPDAGTTGEPEVSLSPTLELGRLRPQSVGVVEGGGRSGYLPMFYNNKRTRAEADSVSVIALNETTDINATLLRGIFLPLIQR